MISTSKYPEIENILSEYITSLIENGNKDEINIPNEKGWTPLIFALKYSTDAVIKRLIHFGASANARINVSETALMIAIMENKDSIVQKLINVVHPETGLLLTNINLQTKLGWTALILAIRNNKDNIATMLINAKDPITRNPIIDINLQTETGWTALMQAIEKGEYNIVEM